MWPFFRANPNKSGAPLKKSPGMGGGPAPVFNSYDTWYPKPGAGNSAVISGPGMGYTNFMLAESWYKFTPMRVFQSPQVFSPQTVTPAQLGGSAYVAGQFVLQPLASE